jgi:hypothetical protein
MAKRKSRTKRAQGTPGLGEMKTRDLLRSIRADLRRKMADRQVPDKPKQSD